MNLATKAKVIAIVGALVLAFVGGRYSIPQSATTSTEVSKEHDTGKTHTITTTTETKSPSGEVKTVTTTDTVATTDSTKKQTNTETTVVAAKHSALNVSLLGGYDVIHREGSLQYGMSVTKEVLAPLTVGVFGLNNGTLGLSVGINF